MHDARLLAKVLYGKAKSKEQVTGSKGEKNKMQGTYIQKAGVTGVKILPILGSEPGTL